MVSSDAAYLLFLQCLQSIDDSAASHDQRQNDVIEALWLIRWFQANPCDHLTEAALTSLTQQLTAELGGI